MFFLLDFRLREFTFIGMGGWLEKVDGGMYNTVGDEVHKATLTFSVVGTENSQKCVLLLYEALPWVLVPHPGNTL